MMKKILYLWLLLAAANLGNFAGSFGYWHMPVGDCLMPKVSLWFSPNYASCLTALTEENPDLLYPVAESKDDIPVILAMRDFLKNNSPARALELAKKMPKKISWFEKELWEIRLWRNKSFVLQHGGILPLALRHPSPKVFSKEDALKFLVCPK